MLMVRQVFRATLSAVAKIHIRVSFFRDTTNDAAMERLIFLNGAEPDRLLLHVTPARSDTIFEFAGKKQQKIADGRKHEKPGKPRSDDQRIAIGKPGQ